MAYDLRLDPRVVNYVKELDAKQFRQVVRRILELSQNPRPHDSEQLRDYHDPEAAGRKGYRLDQGESRVLCTIDEAKQRVTVFHAGHRRDVYR
jgi:mRNA interferase RelE/StbE